jgi:hypothetical protein
MFTLLTFQNCSITNLFQLIIIFLIVLNALPLEDMSEKKRIIRTYSSQVQSGKQPQLMMPKGFLCQHHFATRHIH